MGIKQSFVTGLTDLYSTDKEGVGTIRYENNKVYKYVKFTGTTAIAVGQLVCYVAYATDSTGTVVDQAYPNPGIAAGMALAAVGTGTVQYGWIQIQGLILSSDALGGSPAMGDSLVATGTTTATLTKVVTDNAQACAFCYDATAKAIMCDFPH